MIHRLGTVDVGEESILIAVSSPHRQAAWRAGEEALESCKERAEIWKLEEFFEESSDPDDSNELEEEGGEGEEKGEKKKKKKKNTTSVWRANRDGKMGVRVDKEKGSG